MQLNISDMIWSIVNFLVLVFILKKFLYKPLLNVLEKRKEEIVTNLESAKAAEAEAMAMREEYQRVIQQSHTEAQEILDKAVKLGEETKERIIRQAQAEASRITDKAEDIIRQGKEEAIAQLRGEVSALVVEVAGKVIGKTLTQEDHERLIHNFIDEVGDVS